MNAPSTGQQNPMLFQGEIFYVDEGKKESVNSTPPQGNPIARGVVLTSDSLDVSMVVTLPITNDATNPSHPTLAPLVRARFVTTGDDGDTGTDYYNKLFKQTPPSRQTQLTNNNNLPFDDENKNGDLMAYDYALGSNSTILTMADRITLPPAEREEIKQNAIKHAALDGEIRDNAIKNAAVVSAALNDHLNSIGTNDPSYLSWKGASDTLNESTAFLSLY